MKLIRYANESYKSSRARTPRGQKRCKVAHYHFWCTCLDLMSTYESLEQQYDTLATRYASSVLSESAYRKTFAEIMDRYKTLICDYGNNLDRFVNSSMYKHSGTEDKIKGIEDLYLFIQKKYIMMVRLYNLLCPADKHSESPDRPSADSTLLISVSAGSIQKYMKSRE